MAEIEWLEIGIDEAENPYIVVPKFRSSGPDPTAAVARILFSEPTDAKLEVDGVPLLAAGCPCDYQCFSIIAVAALKGELPMIALHLEGMPGWTRVERKNLQQRLNQLVRGSPIVCRSKRRRALYELAPKLVGTPSSLERVHAWLSSSRSDTKPGSHEAIPVRPRESPRATTAGQDLIGGAVATTWHDGDVIDWVTPHARQIAFVGQNLASVLRPGPRYDAFRTSLATLLAREDSEQVSRVQELWLVLRSPHVLGTVDPLGGRNLHDVTIPQLLNLSEFLGHASRRVSVAIHPASELSMLITNWSAPAKRRAHTIEKTHTTRIAARRSTLAVGADYEAKVGDFEHLLKNARDGTRYGALTAALPEAPAILTRLFNELETKYPGEHRLIFGEPARPR
ncbi:MAG: hypothetical protein M3020_02485 [Myxococcota bacterium]|nr:hypothetical protein [Myxococcota bacterium]